MNLLHRSRLSAARWLLPAGLMMGLLGTFASCRTPSPPPVLTGQDIMVIEGSTSIPNDSERAYARRLNQRLSVALTQLGLPFGRLTDDDITPGALSDCKLAMLPYNPFPSAAERDVLLTFLRDGGHLLVFYGQDPVLADAMGFQVDRYVEAPDNDGWSGFHFSDHAVDRGFPESVRQHSPRMYTVQPKTGQVAAVVARWHTDRGSTSREPAVVAGPGGYWMTHVLLEGDAPAKRQMLLAMIGTFLPGVWAVAARHDMAGSAPFADYANQTAAIAALTRTEPGAQAPDGARRVLKLEQAARARLAEGRYRKAWLTAQELREALIDRYASGSPAASDETGCIWMDPAVLTTPDAWTQACASLERSGIHVVFAALTAGPEAGTRIAGARQQGLAVHAWMFCCNAESRSAEELAQLRQQERLQVSASGEVVSWLCPTHPDNRKELCDRVAELARLPGLAGIHLDYIRYRNSDYCYCSGCRGRFEEASGHRITDWPAAVRRKPVSTDFLRWRAGELTRLVHALAGAARQANGELKVSAAVYAGYPVCIASVGQDWQEWLKQGTIDFVCPMNYTSSMDVFAAWTRQQADMTGISRRIYPGIGMSASGIELSADQALAQVQQVRKAGLKGFALFEFDGDSDTLLRRLQRVRSAPGSQKKNVEE